MNIAITITTLKIIVLVNDYSYYYSIEADILKIIKTERK